jgi:uncharacterized membrane protein YwaF
VRAERLFAAGGFLALVGVVLLALEVARTVGSNTLGSAGTILLWVGLGLFAVGAVLTAWSVGRDVPPPSADSDG